MGFNGDRDCMWPRYFTTPLYRLGEHILPPLKEKRAIQRGSSFEGLSFPYVSLSLVSLLLPIRGDSVLLPCTPCRSEMPHTSAQGSLGQLDASLIVKSFSPHCRIVWKWNQQICVFVSVFNYIAIDSPLTMVPQ